MSDVGRGGAPAAAPGPVGTATAAPDLPETRTWDARVSACGRLPGGSGEAVWNALEIVDHLAEVEPTTRSFLRWLEHRFELDHAGARAAARAVRAAGLASVRGQSWAPTDAGSRWLDREDPSFVVAHLHANVRFVGELLAAALEPTTASELLVVANRSFGLGWRTETELAARLAWLRSSGMLDATEDRRLVTTDAGRALLTRVAIQPPTGPEPVGGPWADPLAAVQAGAAREVAALVAELDAAARDAADPARFDRATLAAFGSLGFDGRLVGRSTAPTLVLGADLGRDRSYRVVVVTVPAAGGTITDDDVDWLGLLDRERRLEGEHLAVVAPGPTGARLFERARRVGAAVFSTDRLGALVRQHAAAPVGLEDYRRLFQEPGEARIDLAAGAAETWVHQARLAGRVVAVLRERAGSEGPLTARELALLLCDDGLPGTTGEAEVRPVLDALANPLLGVLSGDPERGYVAAAPLRVVARRLHVLGAALGALAEDATGGPLIDDVASGPTLDIRSY